MEVSFQYQLSINLADLLQLFYDWGQNYEAAFILIARNTLTDTMAQFQALQVFYDRTDIETQMRVDLTNKLGALNVTLASFQLLDITLPTLFNQALVDTENLNLNVTSV